MIGFDAPPYPDLESQEGIVLRRLTIYIKDERGAALVEWAMLVVFIAIVALLAVTAGGNEMSESYSEISSALTEAGP
jgi:Flp pilus assembly pilin Flp